VKALETELQTKPSETGHLGCPKRHSPSCWVRPLLFQPSRPVADYPY